MKRAFEELDTRTLESLGAGSTVREILGQPELWGATQARIEASQPALLAFLHEALVARDRSVVLTGAGSSAFIGEVLQGPLSRRLGRSVRAVPTTDLVTHPREYLVPGTPTLLVSFARSGNSPESVAAIDRADATVGDVRHLIITCNPGGLLARHPTRSPRAVFLLPPQADDQGLAMTGSFTSMALAGLLAFELVHREPSAARVRPLIDAGRRLLDQGDALRRAGSLDFRRAVFLGSGPLAGAARECHLKLQELTAGAVSCTFDSFLGFRHGPRAVVDPRTLLVFLFSGSDAVSAYEEDLLAQINGGERGMLRLGVGGRPRPPDVDLALALDGIPDEERGICSVLTAQVLGVYRALALGLRPDAPSPSGAISRVVKGVTIHPHA